MMQKYLFFLVTFLSSQVLAIENPSTAFYYAANPPLDLLSSYERVIVEPENITPEQLRFMQKQGVTVYAYLSIGEVGPTRTWSKQIKEEWKKSINIGWNSAVMDMSSNGWQQFLLNKQMKKLWQQGYRGFFLDTMDSYHLFAKTDVELLEQRQGMIYLIKTMKEQYKGVHLLFNRGFEILDQVASLSDGVIAESLFSRWNPEKNEYQSVPKKDFQWLAGKLKQVRDDYNLPITVLDYLPPEKREQAESIATQISQLGFTPWVSTPGLDYMGVGSKKLVPRKVLFLYDSRESKLAFHEIHRFLAMPLEYLGYIPDYWDISKGLPNYILKGRYAGIVTWLSGNNSSRDEVLASWVLQQVHQKLPIVFMGRYTLSKNHQLTKLLGLENIKQKLTPPLELKVISTHLGFEAKPVLRQVDLSLINSTKGQAWLKIKDSQNKQITPVFISQWGGAALNPYVVQNVPALGNDDEYSRWIINPFEFLKAALRLKTIPVPDATTESGNRILTLHIDGDGFNNKSQLPGNRYSAEIILDEFLKPTSLPHTVSIVEAEIGKEGINPWLSQTLQRIAREIFKLPNVEIASHSYSHPFNWVMAAKNTKKNRGKKDKNEANKTEQGLYHLPIPGYSYNVEREIKGSIDYIDKTLAPRGKKTKVFLWSGDSLPNQEALAWTTKMQVANLNGGNTIIRKGMNSITNISASGITNGPFFQPYAPIQNENAYTNNWTGPFYGYQRVIETFTLTDLPKRLKPISLYYHFYSGERQASLRALHRVYDWTLKQETLPLWLSEYIPRINAFRSAVYEQIKNGWRIYQAKDLHTLRITEQVQPLDIVNSEGIAGFRELPQGKYIALNGDNIVTLRFNKQSNAIPYLIKSNSRIKYWKNNKSLINFRLAGHQPVTFSLANFSKTCSLKTKNGKLINAINKTNFATFFKFKNYDTGVLKVICEK